MFFDKNNKRKICLITSTRAEYGIMSRLIHMLNDDSDIEFSLVATGMHLSEKFGYTYKEISVPIAHKIDIEIEKPPAHSLALAVEKFTMLFNQIKPDLIVILGDRYEIMGVAQAAMFTNTPIAHLYGGDATFGLIDEAVRHSITKMSHLHFVSCEESKKRVIQLGENPVRVFNFGALGVENTRQVEFLSKEELEKSLEYNFLDKNILVTFHPVTLEGNVKKQFDELIYALNELKDTGIIFTCPNSDEGNNYIFEAIKDFEKSNSNVKSYKSLGLKRYLSTLQFVDMVVGNSSSGIYEVPSFKIPTINIGNRQKGRMQAKSVINCSPIKSEILKAIESGYLKDFSNVINPYEKENTALNIKNILKSFDLSNIIEKEFYDVEFKK